MKKQDMAVAAYLVAAFAMMIIPIPSWLLDILLACNIALGAGYVLLSHHPFVHYHFQNCPEHLIHQIDPDNGRSG